MSFGWPLLHVRRCFAEAPDEPHQEIIEFLRLSCTEDPPEALVGPLPDRQGHHLLDFDNDPTINNLLRKLYQNLNHGDQNAQVLIDGYLFLCGMPLAPHDKQTAGHSRGMPYPDFALVTLHNDTIQYLTLPDIAPMATAVLAMEEKGDSQLLMLFRQCIPFRKRTKRAQKDIDWAYSDQHALKTCIRVLYGLLLGLYPNNAKRTSFRARVAINALMHYMLIAPFSEKVRRLPILRALRPRSTPGPQHGLPSRSTSSRPTAPSSSSRSWSTPPTPSTTSCRACAGSWTRTITSRRT